MDSNRANAAFYFEHPEWFTVGTCWMVRVISGYLARKPSAAAFQEGRFSTLVQVQTVMLDLPPGPDAGG